MATVLRRSDCWLFHSVNTPDFLLNEYIIDPDLSAVEGVPRYYWKVAGDAVVEMSAAEKAVADAAELERSKDAKLQILRENTLQRLAAEDADYRAAEAAVGAAGTIEEVWAIELLDTRQVRGGK